MATAAKRRRPATVRDMVLSLAVVGGAIGLFVVLLPSTPHQKVTAVEYAPAARALARDSRLPVFVPDPLPPGWQANFVHIDNAPDGLHIGFVLDAKRFARLDETAQADDKFYRDSRVSPAAGTPTAGGFELRRDGSHVGLLRHLTGGGVLTLSDGGSAGAASLAELQQLAASLRLQAG